MFKTHSRSGTTGDNIPLAVKIREAMTADGSIIRAPETPKDISTKGWMSYGTVPTEWRGLTDLYNSQRREIERISKTLKVRFANCKAGDCACRKHVGGLDEEIAFVTKVRRLFEQATQVEDLLAPVLLESLNGLDIRETDYAIGGDWRVMAPKKEPESIFASMEMSLGGTLVIDAREFAGLSFAKVKQRLKAKLGPHGDMLEQVGVLDSLAASIAKEPGASQRRSPFEGFGFSDSGLSRFLGELGPLARRAAGRRTATAGVGG